MEQVYIIMCMEPQIENMCSKKRTASLDRQFIMCPMAKTLREEDNLSIVDEVAGPDVSFIGRFHCN